MAKITNYTDKEYQEIGTLIKGYLLTKKDFQDFEGDMDDIIAEGLNSIIIEMNKLTNK